jgi:hypothetical protein
MTIGAGHSFLLFVISLFAAVSFIFRGKLSEKFDNIKNLREDQKLFISYIVLMPAIIYFLSFLVSISRPMIAFRYIWPTCAPYCYAAAAVGIWYIHSLKKWNFISVLLIYMIAVGLYDIIPAIPSGGIEGYREARAYIAADTNANPQRSAAMLDNSPATSAYYGYAQIPSLSENPKADVLYIYNDIFFMHENDMYKDMKDAGIEDKGLLRIHFDYRYPRADGAVIFKKYLKD